MKILCVCLSPSIQRTLVFDQFAAGQVNRTKNFIQNAGGKAINTARVIEQLAPNSAVCIFPLAKQNAGEFLSLLKKDGINSKTVPVPLRARTCWTVLSAHGKTTEIIAEEPVPSVSSVHSAMVVKSAALVLPVVETATPKCSAG